MSAIIYPRTSWALRSKNSEILIFCPQFFANLMAQTLVGWSIAPAQPGDGYDITLSYDGARYTIDSIMLDAPRDYGDMIDALNEVFLCLSYHVAANTPDAVLIHDAARACVTRDVIDRVIAALQNAPAAAPGIAVVDALWTTQDDHVTGTTPRDGLMRAQTPQGFHYPTICKAHDTIQDTQAADDVDIARRAGLTVRVVAGSEDNIKITTPQDFTRAAHILRTRQ